MEKTAIMESETNNRRDISTEKNTEVAALPPYPSTYRTLFTYTHYITL
jgi:hypothetical protein